MMGYFWRPFCRPSRENAAADYKRGHDCPENPKLHLWHLRCSPSPNTTTSHYKTLRVSSLAQQLRQLGDIRRRMSEPCPLYPRKRTSLSTAAIAKRTSGFSVTQRDANKVPQSDFVQERKCPLMTQSGHGRLRIAAVQTYR